MPPHPLQLERWLQEGEPLPPFLVDPDFFQREGINQPAAEPSGLTGTIRALAVVVDFSDKVGTVTASFFDSLVFAPPVSGRGSVRDYFDEVSYGQVDIVTVNLPSSLGWVRAPSSYAYYTNGNYCWGSYPQNCRKLAEDVVDAVNAVVDFANYDNDGDGRMEPVMLVHAGPGAEFTGSTWDVWSHSWTLAYPRFYDGVLIDRYVIMPEYWMSVSPTSSDMTVGVFCHEMGHGFWGLPDLYDTDYSSRGVGKWSLMSFGSWNGPNSGGWGSDGSSPAWPDAWSRIQMGVDAATLVVGPMPVTFPPVETTSNAVARFDSSALQGQEFFLAENRQRLSEGYDEYLPASGLLIWHVDESRASNTSECRTIPHCSGACAATHFRVALEQADGFDDLEFAVNSGDAGDPFPGSSNRTFWQPYAQNPGVNPESGSWFDNGCALDSCIDITNIACAPLSDCTADVNRAGCAGDHATADLGDAPASQNTFGLPMTAYGSAGPLPWVQANFPSVYLPAPNAPGPRHVAPQADSWLGGGVSQELNADWPPDQDGTTNITPTLDLADLDSLSLSPSGDDGVALPIVLDPCTPMTLPYTVTIAAGAPVITRYVNVWFDWNRDGDWDDVPTCPGGVPAAEWAVPDEAFRLGAGVYGRVSGPFTPRVTLAEDASFEAWMRISVAEAAAPTPQDGRGPAQGYDHGETEDYRLYLAPVLTKTADLSHDPVPGERVSYRIVCEGQGNVVAAGAVLSDVLPSGVEYVSSDPPGSYDPATRTVTWGIDLVPSAPATLTLEVEITGAVGDAISNTVHLLWADAVWKRASLGFRVGCEADDPQVAFTWTSPVCAGKTIAFANLSTGTLPLSYTWDLDGDGVVDSTEADPTWVYGAEGTYTVTLMTTNGYGCSDAHAEAVEVVPTCRYWVYLPLVVRR